MKIKRMLRRLLALLVVLFPPLTRETRKLVERIGARIHWLAHTAPAL